MSLREYLELNGDKLVATVIVSVIVASLVGFRRRSTPMAMFVSNVSSAILSAAAFPVAVHYGLSWDTAVGVVGVTSGTCAFAAFSVLMRVADKLEGRADQIADKIINKAIPKGESDG